MKHLIFDAKTARNFGEIIEYVGGPGTYKYKLTRKVEEWAKDNVRPFIGYRVADLPYARVILSFDREADCLFFAMRWNVEYALI
jgi:hypothetical protein